MESPAPSPIVFAHRGASGHAPANTLEAFRLGLRLGATGLESDVWTTADGVPVLDHHGKVKAGLRRRPVAVVDRSDLPPGVPTLEDLYAGCGSAYQLSLDVKDPAALPAVLAVAAAAGAVGRLWLCHPDLEVLAAWRCRSVDVKLVNSTRIRSLRRGPERHAARMAALGVDAVNLHATEWTGGHVALFHRFGRLAFGWDAQHERVVRQLARMGVDGIYGDHVDRLVDGVASAGR